MAERPSFDAIVQELQRQVDLSVQQGGTDAVRRGEEELVEIGGRGAESILLVDRM